MDDLELRVADDTESTALPPLPRLDITQLLELPHHVRGRFPSPLALSRPPQELPFVKGPGSSSRHAERGKPVAGASFPQLSTQQRTMGTPLHRGPADRPTPHRRVEQRAPPRPRLGAAARPRSTSRWLHAPTTSQCPCRGWRPFLTCSRPPLPRDASGRTILPVTIGNVRWRCAVLHARPLTACLARTADRGVAGGHCVRPTKILQRSLHLPRSACLYACLLASQRCPIVGFETTRFYFSPTAAEVKGEWPVARARHRFSSAGSPVSEPHRGWRRAARV